LFRRILAGLAIPAAAVALSGAVLSSTAGTASAATTAPRAAVTAGQASAPGTRQATAAAKVSIFYDMYSSDFLCSLSGRGLEGTNQVINGVLYYINSFECLEDDGVYNLILEATPLICPAVSASVPGKLPADTNASPLVCG
jgi:hypothetical protein